MRILNLLESMAYSLVKLFLYTLIFSFVNIFIFRDNNFITESLRWCVPISIGMFIGYLGGRSFSFLKELRNVIVLIFILLIITFAVSFLVKKMYFDDQDWIKNTIFFAIPFVYGIVKSIPAGLESTTMEEEKEFDDSSEDN